MPRPLITLLLFVAAAGAQHTHPGVFSGELLNELAARIAARKAPISAEPEPALAVATLAAINIARVGGADGPGGTLLLLRADKIAWPDLLKEVPEKEGVKRFQALARQAVKEAGKGKVADETRKALAAVHKAMLAHVEAHVEDVSPGQFIEARRFLNIVKASLPVLADPKAGELLALAEDVNTKPRSAAELARLFREKKLRFAPCLPDGMKHYRVLYDALHADAHRLGVKE